MKKTLLGFAALMLAMQGCKKDKGINQELMPQEIGSSGKSITHTLLRICKMLPKQY